MDTDKPTLIAALAVENVKRIQAVQLSPNGKSVMVKGRNAQGKSSLIDAIAYALGGAKLCPAAPIRKGQETASAEVQLDNGLKILRTWTQAGTYLKVTTAEGAEVKSPQKVLDELAGTLTFDPLAFSRKTPAEQRAELLDLIGLTDQLKKIEAEEAKVYGGRRDWGRERDRLKGAADEAASKLPAGPKPAPIDTADLTKTIGDAMRLRTEREQAEGAAQNKSTRASTRAVSLGQRAVELRKQLEIVQADFKAAKAEADAAAAELVNLQAKHAAEPLPDAAAMSAKVQEAETVNATIRQFNAVAALKKEAAEADAQYKAHTKALDNLGSQKTELLTSAKMPIPGIGFDVSGVLYRDIPLAQCSAAEQLRISTSVAMAANPHLRVLFIRDASLLDEDGLAAVWEASNVGGYQLFIERVGTGTEPGAVVIEDGAVVSDLIDAATPA